MSLLKKDVFLLKKNYCNKKIEYVSITDTNDGSICYYCPRNNKFYAEYSDHINQPTKTLFTYLINVEPWRAMWKILSLYRNEDSRNEYTFMFAEKQGQTLFPVKRIYNKAMIRYKEKLAKEKFSLEED